MTAHSEMPHYICHKRVRAIEVVDVGNYVPSDAGLVRLVQFKGFPAPHQIKDELFRRYVPVPGDFFVVYEDGYQSFSPRKAFLDGYKRSEPSNDLMQRLNDARAVYSGTPEALKGLLTEAYTEILRLRADTVVTREMAGFREIKQSIEEKSREKTDPDQSAG